MKTISNTKLSKNNWIVEGIIWGAFMIIFTVFFVPIVTDYEVNLKEIPFWIVWWLSAGLGYGYITNKLGERKNKKEGN